MPAINSSNQPSETAGTPPTDGVPELEFDEDIAPRPEEEIADSARAVPDTADHSGSGS